MNSAALLAPRAGIMRTKCTESIAAILTKPRMPAGVPRFSLALAFALALALSAACSSAEPTVEARARKLDNDLICPVCPGETIDQSQVQIAKDMKRIVREKLAAGESEEEIKDFFVDRYGPSVLAAPPASGFNAALWVLPPMGLLLGIGALAWTVRSMRKRNGLLSPAGADPETTDPELASYIAAVDAELADEAEESSADEQGSSHGQGKEERQRL